MRRGVGILAVVLFAAAALLAGVLRPVDPTGAPRVVIIPPGTSAAEIGHRLEAAGLVRRASAVVLVARVLGLTRALQEGEYLLSPASGVVEIVTTISRGDVLLHAVTIPEGFTAEEIAQTLAARGLGDRGQLLELVRAGASHYDYEFLRAARIASLEGYLFPDTYRLPRHWREREIVRQFLDRFAEVVVPRWQARGAGRTLHEIVTMASLVEREAQVAAERPLIAGVLYNRLRRGLRLEVDATVLYALGRHKNVVTFDDLTVDSPYNTYRYPGLPPGPIANPGLPAIEAALNPASTDYLYYVAKPDGSHAFSRTFEEHLAAIRRYQRRP